MVSPNHTNVVSGGQKWGGDGNSQNFGADRREGVILWRKRGGCDSRKHTVNSRMGDMQGIGKWTKKRFLKTRKKKQFAIGQGQGYQTGAKKKKKMGGEGCTRGN